MRVVRFIPKIFLASLGLGFLVITAFTLGRLTGLKVKKAGVTSPTPITQTTAKKEINQEIVLAEKTKSGKNNLKLEIVSAEILEEVVVKGQKVRASAGRSFLVFTIKVTNEGKNGLQINSRNFIRLSGVDKEEWVAPDVHSDPVEVQAIATKFARVGFIINGQERQFRLKLGEIDGEKTELELAF